LKIIYYKKSIFIYFSNSGCYFISKFISKIKNKKIILLNPYIYIENNIKNNIFYYLFYYLFYCKIFQYINFYLPLIFLINSSNLTYYGEELYELLKFYIKNIFNFTNIKLNINVSFDIKQNDLINNLIFYNKFNNNDISIIYCIDENLTKINNDNLIKLSLNFNTILICGKHESFNNDYKNVKNNYLYNFKQLLKK
jgi:hypothetical protein